VKGMKLRVFFLFGTAEDFLFPSKLDKGLIKSSFQPLSICESLKISQGISPGISQGSWLWHCPYEQLKNDPLE